MRRLFWVGVGFALGMAASRRGRSGQVGDGSQLGLRGRLRAHVQDAIAEGRDEARRREAALRAVLASTENGAEGAER